MQEPSMTVAELISLPIMDKCDLLAGSRGIEKRRISRINIVDTPDIARWMLGEEFMMTTGYVMRENPLEIKDLIIELNNSNVSALGIKLGRFINALPEEVLLIADKLEFPILSLPMDCSFSEVMIAFMAVLSKNNFKPDEKPSMEVNYQDFIAGSFLEMMAGGKGINEILQHLKLLISAEVAYLDHRKKLTFVTDENNEFYESIISRPLGELQKLFHVFSLDAAGGTFGLIVINSPKDQGLPLSWHSSINFAKTAIVLHLQKEQAIKQVELRYKNSFFKDLIFDHIHREDQTMEQKMASFFGTSFLPPYAVMIVDRDNIASYEGKNKSAGLDPVATISSIKEDLYTRIYRFLKVNFGRVHFSNIGGKMVVLVSLFPDSGKNLAKLEQLIGEFKSSYRVEHNCSLSVSIGCEVNDIFNVNQSYKQAKTCIEFVRSSGIADALFVWSKMGIMRLLISASNNKANKEEIKNFVDQYLGVFKQMDQADALRHLETLEALSKHGWNLKSAAKAMHVHFNTIRYRLKTIADLVPFDLDNPEVRLEIFIALKLFYLNKDLNLF